jgi:hypothetical protein
MKLLLTEATFPDKFLVLVKLLSVVPNRAEDELVLIYFNTSALRSTFSLSSFSSNAFKLLFLIFEVNLSNPC